MLANSIGNHIIIHLIDEHEGKISTIHDDEASNLGDDDVDDFDDENEEYGF